jgi:hypothetical protein
MATGRRGRSIRKRSRGVWLQDLPRTIRWRRGGEAKGESREGERKGMLLGAGAARLLLIACCEWVSDALGLAFAQYFTLFLLL